MKLGWRITVFLIVVVAFSGGAILAQERRANRNDQNRQAHTRFDEHDRQVTTNWYNQHKDNAPGGFRERDRLSSDEESRLQPGVTLDRNLQRKEHSVPYDLQRQLPPPPRNHRYVGIGGHVAIVDNHHQVKDVIHLHGQ